MWPRVRAGLHGWSTVQRGDRHRWWTVTERARIVSGFCHGDLTVLPFFPHSLGLRPFFRLRSSSPLSSVLSVLSAFQEGGGGGGDAGLQSRALTMMTNPSQFRNFDFASRSRVRNLQIPARSSPFPKTSYYKVDLLQCLYYWWLINELIVLLGHFSFEKDRQIRN